MPPKPVPSSNSTVHQPQRGDDVERWLRRMRSAYDPRCSASRRDRLGWEIIDDLLNRYRECSDYGLTLRPDDDEAGDP